MIMPLIAQEDGIVQFIKQPGATLEGGDILGVLSLDDPSRVQHAKSFDGQLPPMGLPSIIGNKPHQRFNFLMAIFHNIIAGYDNQAILQASVKELIAVLRDPELPFSEASAILSTLSGRMPSSLEGNVRSAIEGAHGKSEFPSSKLRKLLDAQYADMRAAECTALQSTLAAFEDVVNRYMKGLKYHECSTIAGILDAYIATETVFSGREDDVVLELRDTHRDSPDEVVAIVRSHYKAASKNSLIMALLDVVKGFESLAVVEAALSDTLKKCADLDSKATSKVSLKAREVLIHCQLPSLDERLVQLEQILKASINQVGYGEMASEDRSPREDILKDVIDSRFTVFDVLPSFFESSEPWIVLAALDTYVRRAYRSYNLVSLEHVLPEDGTVDYPAMLSWSFKMRRGTGESGRATPVSGGLMSQRTASFSDLTFLLQRGQEEPLRYGTMTAVKNLDQFEQILPGILDQFPDNRAAQLSTSASSQENWNVLNVAMCFAPGAQVDETALHERFVNIINQSGAKFDRRGMRRVSLLLCPEGQYPSYFTVRKQDGVWKEVSTIRDIEPALAYQLELARLSNFNLTPAPTENRQIHTYYAVGKDNSTDCRFFVRVLVRPGRLRGNMKTVDYLVSETDRLVGDVLNTLEVASASRRAADGNHIFVRRLSGAQTQEPADMIACSSTLSTACAWTLRRSSRPSLASSRATASASGACVSLAPRSASCSRTVRATFSPSAPSLRTSRASSSSTRRTARCPRTRARPSSSRSARKAPCTCSLSTIPTRPRSGSSLSATRRTSSARPTSTTSPTCSARPCVVFGRRATRLRRPTRSWRTSSSSTSLASLTRFSDLLAQTAWVWSAGSTR